MDVIFHTAILKIQEEYGMSKKATIIVFSSDLDKVLAAFNIALGAASAQMQVTMFFTFWGLNVIRKKKSGVSKKDFTRKAFGIINKGGENRLKLSRFNMGGVGAGLIKRLMDRLKMPRLKEMISMTNDMGVKFIACTTTMELMGIDKEAMLPEVKGFAGVATYIDEASQSEINLFI